MQKQPSHPPVEKKKTHSTLLHKSLSTTNKHFSSHMPGVCKKCKQCEWEIYCPLEEHMHQAWLLSCALIWFKLLRVNNMFDKSQPLTVPSWCKSIGSEVGALFNSPETHLRSYSRTLRSAGRCRSPMSRVGSGWSAWAWVWAARSSRHLWGWCCPGKSAREAANPTFIINMLSGEDSLKTVPRSLALVELSILQT